MADNLSKEDRYKNMSRIRSINSKPEEIVRKFLFSKGLRYRKNAANLPGKPDIVLKKYKAIVMVNGCFWHKHDCNDFKWPKSNIDYWNKKINRNLERDKEVTDKLVKMGWKVIVVWECQLKKESVNDTLNYLYNQIISQE